jgi:hypothetical protein
MKHANNNEVDLLLRSLAGRRKQSPPQSGNGEPVRSPHLDADELNSYAEGKVPEVARARYIEHLADCESCRGILVSLAQAAGTTSRLRSADKNEEPGFWQKLSQFFSPKVLSFAVPVLVLTAVIGISFLALRQRSGPKYVAQNEQPVAAPSMAVDNIDSKLNSAAKSQPTVQNGTQPPKTTEPAKVGSVLRDEKGQEKQESLKPDSTVGKPAPEKDARQSADTASVAEPYAPEPKAAAAPASAPMVQTAKSGELAKEQSVRREDQPRDQEEGVRVGTDDLHGPHRARNDSALSSTRGSAGIVAKRGPSDTDKNKKAETEVRSVMGRHFTWQGDAWVDTAYEASRATVRVNRGSDQFRALVADEPGLRTIADQLSGVVIVIWKNRAYRIQ